MSNAFDYMDREIAAGRMNNLSAEGIFSAVGASEKTRAAYTKGLTDEIERTKDLARTTNDLGKTQDRYNKYQLETGGALINNVSVLDTVKSGFKSFASTAGSIAANIGTNMLINAGIQAVGWGIDKVVNAQSDKIKAGTEVLDNYKSVNQEMAQAT